MDGLHLSNPTPGALGPTCTARGWCMGVCMWCMYVLHNWCMCAWALAWVACTHGLVRQQEMRPYADAPRPPLAGTNVFTRVKV